MELAIFIPVYIRTGSALLDQSPDKDVFVWPRFGSVCSQCSHRQLVSHSLHPNWIQGYDPSCKTEQIFAFLYEKELVLEVVRVMSFVNTWLQLWHNFYFSNIIYVLNGNGQYQNILPVLLLTGVNTLINQLWYIGTILTIKLISI